MQIKVSRCFLSFFGGYRHINHRFGSSDKRDKSEFNGFF